MIVSHFHIDHAGLAGFLLQKGIELIVFKNQLYAIDEMESLISGKRMAYEKIDRDKMTIKDVSESRRWLESINIIGEILQTDGHGDQSVTLLLDDGVAFVGDLPPAATAGDYNGKIQSNWDMLFGKGARIIKPAHAAEFMIEE